MESFHKNLLHMIAYCYHLNLPYVSMCSMVILYWTLLSK